MKKLIIAFALVAGLFFAGCTTPESRIRENPAAFDRATPEQQNLIKQGQVAIGFDMELVQLALGVADHVRERVDVNGKQVIWSYVTYEGSNGMMLYRGWYHRSHYWGATRYAYFADYPDRREREHFRVVFKDGKVTEIEQET